MSYIVKITNEKNKITEKQIKNLMELVDILKQYKEPIEVDLHKEKVKEKRYENNRFIK